ncbi:MAG TPA: glycosyltransferase, partial [Bryobacteraceae bacterium]|nr:glycosyltransferase [Bryobacteraceae bacterium]
MRVLLVIEATLGGSGRHVLDLADGLLTSAHEVHLVYSPLRADESFLSRLAILRTERPGFYCQAVSITREVSISDISAYRALTRYIREQGPFDVIHAHSTKAGLLARLLLNTQGAGMVYTPHGLMTLDPQLTGLRRRAVSVLESMLAHGSDAIVSVSISEHACAIETGIRPKKLVVIPNGIRTLSINLQAQQRCSLRASLGLSADTVCIGFVGRF